MFSRLKYFMPMVKMARSSLPVIYLSSELKGQTNNLHEELQHEFLIRQACTVNINSSSQLITVTSLALQDICAQICHHLSEEISLLNLIMEFDEANVPEEYCDELIAIKNKLNKLELNLITFSGYLDHAEKVATAAAEISYLTGNIAGSDAICERINQATLTCSREKESVHNLRLESLKVQKQAIEKVSRLKKIIVEPEQ